MNTIKKICTNGAIGAVMGLYISCIATAVETVTDNKILCMTIMSAITFSTVLTLMPKIYDYIDYKNPDDYVKNPDDYVDEDK